jgi:hypothetical protein
LRGGQQLGDFGETAKGTLLDSPPAAIADADRQ